VKTLLIAIGTRPEAIKMAPVISALARAPWASVRLLATAQHRELLDDALGVFGLTPDVDLDIMQPEQNLPALTSRLLPKLDSVLADESPDAVLVQGDTTTVMAVALAAYYRQIPVGHVEAGLRSGDLYNPFPEEMNRIVADRIARWLFAPTDGARDHLLAEGIAAERIHVTGNTVIDALLTVAARTDLPDSVSIPDGARMILVTAHRRENFGAPLAAIFGAVRELAERRDDVYFVCPVHPNPNVTEAATRWLADHPRILCTAPMNYPQFVATLKRAHLVLTDSGGLQEEAPALGKPVLVTRTRTERPEAVAAGVAKLVGPDREAIVRHIEQLLDDESAWRAMSVGASPYGDGHAAARIVEVFEREL
jgi:UDP-N-acetylglucosamine 2-epimerase (non-hydrolysing)